MKINAYKILTLLVIITCTAPTYAGVITYDGLQEWRLEEIPGEADALGTYISYYDFHVAAPGDVSFTVLHDGTAPYYVPAMRVMGYCGDSGLWESCGDLMFDSGVRNLDAGSYAIGVSSDFVTAIDFGSPWEYNGLADPTFSYDPVFFTLEITGDFISAIPEPGALSLLLFSFAGLVLLRCTQLGHRRSPARF